MPTRGAGVKSVAGLAAIVVSFPAERDSHHRNVGRNLIASGISIFLPPDTPQENFG